MRAPSATTVRTLLGRAGGRGGAAFRAEAAALPPPPRSPAWTAASRSASPALPRAPFQVAPRARLAGGRAASASAAVGLAAAGLGLEAVGLAAGSAVSPPDV